MRLFVAVPIEEAAVLERLSRVAGPVGSRGIKWVPRHQMHLTLKFLGEVGDGRLVAVREALATALGGLAAFHLSLEGTGCFPPRGPARVVWAGCGEGAEALVEVAGRVEKALVAAGFSADERPFSAHLTLGRVKDPSAGREVARRVQALPAETFGRVLVDQVVLFSSVLSPSGPTYSPLQRVRLS